MDSHVIAYLQRPRLPIWKRITVARTDQPNFAYSSNDERVFLNQVVPCCTLWVVSIPYDGWPPELTARIKVIDRGVVASKKLTKWRRRIPELKAATELSLDPALIDYFPEDIIAVGDPNLSEFFGHNNAEKAVLDLALVREGHIERLRDFGPHWLPSYGRKFHRPALIADAGMEQGAIVSPGAEPLNSLKKTAAKTVFISYKWNDIKKLGKQRFLLRIAREMARSDMMVWLDKLALPGYAPKGDHSETEEDKKVKRLLKYGYERSAALVAIGTPNYGQPTRPGGENWTLGELTGELAPNKNIKRVVLPFTKKLPECLREYAKLPISDDASAAAFYLKDWMNQECG